MNYIKREHGFTLVEVLAVIIIIGVLGAVAIPKLVSSTINARQKADVATAHQVKAALDRYQLENGAYPIEGTDFKIADGEVIGVGFIPKYISKLDASTTQQAVPENNKGFGIASLVVNPTDSTQYIIPDLGEGEITNIIMIYLNSNGLAAEVQAYDEKLVDVLWTSAN